VGPVTHHTFCRICEASCGLRVEVERGAVTAIQPDPDHVGTAGYACLKGLLQHELYASPDRLSRPLKRVGNEHMEISWDQAMTEIGARVRAIHGERGGDALGMYVGTAAGFGVLHPIFAQGFMQGLGSRSMYSSATQDCANKFSVATEMYGFPFVQPFPDVDRTECLIVVGANPAVSKWRPRGREDELSQVRLPMRTLADLMPGVVALPHGWGHQHAKGLRVAQRTRSVNVNLLAADGADALERSSGMARLTAIEVEVSRATGPQDSTSWSGLPAVS